MPDDPSDSTDANEDLDGANASVDDVPTVSCSRCGTSWDLSFELEELQVGNQAVEQFALDHQRHTGHFPDDVSPWVADCGRCPAGERFLGERAARRWARTHARHARHDVELDHGSLGSVEHVRPPDR